MTHPAIERCLQAQEYAGNLVSRPVMEAVKCTDEGNMKLTVNVDDLRDALAYGTVPLKKPVFMPVLSHVLLVAHQNRLILTSTNMGTAVSLSLPAEVECSGAYTIHAKLLLKCVKILPKKECLAIEVRQSELVLTCGTRTFLLKGGGPACNYPALREEFRLDTAYVLSSDRLRQGIREVLLPTFSTVCLRVQEDLIELIATDGHCLALRTMKSEYCWSRREMIIQVPVESMRVLAKVLPQEEEVVITWNADCILFQTSHVQVVARLFEGTLPLSETYPNVYKSHPVFGSCFIDRRFT